MILSDLNSDKIYYRFPYNDWMLEFSNNTNGTALGHYGISHQSVNGSQLSSLQEYIDNGYATLLGSGGTSSSSNESSSSISTTEFCKCNFEATNVGHGGRIFLWTMLHLQMNQAIGYTQIQQTIALIRPPSNGLYNISSYLHVFTKVCKVER